MFSYLGILGNIDHCPHTVEGVKKLLYKTCLDSCLNILILVYVFRTACATLYPNVNPPDQFWMSFTFFLHPGKGEEFLENLQSDFIILLAFRKKGLSQEYPVSHRYQIETGCKTEQSTSSVRSLFHSILFCEYILENWDVNRWLEM